MAFDSTTAKPETLDETVSGNDGPWAKFKPQSAEQPAPEARPWSKFDPNAADIGTPPTKKPSGVLDTFTEGVKSAGRALGATVDTVANDSKGVVQAAKEQRAAPKAAPLEKFYGDIAARKEAAGEDPGLWDSIKAVGGAVVDNPAGAGHAIVEQMPNAVPALGGGLAGMKAGAALGTAIAPGVGTAVGGVVGGLAGMFAGNAAIETGHKAMEAADDGQFTPDERSQAMREGATKGAVITAVDALTLGASKWITGAGRRAVESATQRALTDVGVDVADLASVTAARANPAISATVRSAQQEALKATETLTQRVARGGAALGLESFGEGLGEYLGELAATGKTDMVDAVLESLLSLGQSGAEVAWGAARNKKGEDGGVWEEAPGATGDADQATTPGLLPPPAANTGTPSDQILQADVERNNALAEAESHAREIYRRRAEFEAQRTPTPSEQMGIDPAAGPMSKAAARAVDTGVSVDAVQSATVAAQARADQLAAEESGFQDVPQSTPPDGRAIIRAQQEAEQRALDEEVARNRAEASPDDEIYQAIGRQSLAPEPMGVDVGDIPALAEAQEATPARLAPFTQSGAESVAARWTTEKGEPYAVVPHPIAKDRFAVVPARQVQASSADAAGVIDLQGSPSKLGGALPADGQAPALGMAGEKINRAWTAFAEDSGSLGVPRAEMPQIKAEHRGAMTNFMNARGVAHAQGFVPADSLKPTQAEFSPAKVKRAAEHDGGDRSILVSADGYVLDGHHQWLAKRDAGEQIKVTRLDAPIQQLIKLAHEFPSSTTARGAKLQGPVLQNRDRSTPSSIAQMQAIAASPDYGRMGPSRDFANGAPVVAGGQVPAEQMGRQDVAVASDGRRITVQYAVVEADGVLASNYADGRVNGEYGGATGAMRAIAGNGRVAGIQEAHQRGTAGDYRRELEADAAMHGVDAAVVQGMRQPVLVRVMPAEEITDNIGDVSNTQSNLHLSAVEQAANDVRRVDLDSLEFSEDGAPSVNTVRQFVRVMPASEQGALVDSNGQPTVQAIDRLNAAIFARAYGNDGLVRLYAQAADPEARLVLSALARVAPKMARLEGAGALDIRMVVTQAAEIAVNSRRQGVPLARAAEQVDMAADPLVGRVLALFARNPRSNKEAIERLSALADLAYAEATKADADMFGDVPRLERAQVFDRTTGDGHEREREEDLAQPAGSEPVRDDAVRPGAGERAAPADAGQPQAGRPAEAAGQDRQVGQSGAEAQNGAPPANTQFPFTKTGAQKRADELTQRTGTQHEIAAHPAVHGRFVVVQTGGGAQSAAEATGAQAASSIKDVVAKQIPDMSDEELQRAIAHYGPEHKRTAKLRKEAQKRAGSASAPVSSGAGAALQAPMQGERDRVVVLTEQWNDLVHRYKAADESGKGIIRPAMDLLDAEIRQASRQDLLRASQGIQKAADEHAAGEGVKAVVMPIGARLRPSEHAPEKALYWEKTGPDEWTGRGDWFQKGKIKSSADLMRHGGLVPMEPDVPTSNKTAAPGTRINTPAEQKAQAATAGLKNAADRFANNKMFTSDKVAAARARLKAKLGTLNSGIDPELLIDGMTIAGGYIESGVRKYSEYAHAMVADFGDAIRPYLRSFYEAARNYPGLDTRGMTTAAELDLMESQGAVENGKPASEDAAAELEDAKQRAAGAIAKHLEAMKSVDVVKFAARFMPTVGMKSSVSGPRNIDMLTDPAAVNLLDVADALGLELSQQTRRALESDAAGTPMPLALTAPTRSELLQRQQAQEQAQADEARAERVAEQRERADAERDSFTLAGSDRQADMLAARGQAGLFDTPQETAHADDAPLAIGKTVEAPKGAKRRKLPGESTLRDDYGVSHIDGYNDTPMRETGNAIKDQFLADTRKFLKDVGNVLEARGFVAANDRNGKPVRSVSVNESGVAVSGDVSLSMFNPGLDRGIYIHIAGTALRGAVPSTKSGVSVMMRTTKAGDPYGGDRNLWMPVDLSSAELADMAADEVQKAAASAGTQPALDKAALADQNESANKESSDAIPVQTQPVSEGTSGETQTDAAARHRDSEPVGAGLAAGGQGVDRGESVSGRTDGAGAAGAAGVEPAWHQPSGETRDRAGVRSESGAADTDDHVIDADEIGKGGLGQKYRDNIAAIKIIKALETEGRAATAAERKALAKYVGWGAMKGPFDPENKAWAKQHAELKSLLTDAEFRAARASTLDAHYTSPVAVGAMYEALTRLGVKSGRFLEPSVGVGNFFGLMPREMRTASQLHGVELDSLTSRLVAALYPKAKIAKATGFQDFEIPSGFFDVVIGNPPFGSHPLVDKERSPYSGFSIHNYFLAKSIDKLRPGGVMAVVVSHNFLDAQDGRVRKWIGERASLIGGVRLPNTAFKENAGTEVVTDILIFQKHDGNGLPSSVAPWQAVVEQVNTNPKTGEHVAHKVSQFFVANPQFVLGKPSAGGTMYSANEYTVEQDGDIKELLAKWVKTLPENVFDNIDRARDAGVVDMAVPDGVKVGSYYLDNTGKVMRRGDDLIGEKTAVGWEPRYESQIGRMKGMIAIRDTLRSQMRLERSVDATEQEIEANRAELNQLYDDFLKKYKHLNSTTNRSIFLDDTEAHLIQGLEFDYDKGVGKAAAEKEGTEQREASAAKADIFHRRVAFPPQDYMTVSTAKDALLASLNYRGRVDGAYMAEVYGKPMDTIIEELGDVVFDDPQAGIVTADEYLSGDVKTKLDEARAAAQDDTKYRRNVDALEKVIPKDKTPSEISVSIGAAFVPGEIYEQFVNHISGGTATAAYVKATGQWLMAFHAGSDPALNTGRFGTSDLSAQDLFQLTMLGRGAVVKKTLRNADGSTTTILLEKETEAAREKQNAIKAEWQKWLWQEPERAERIASIYNDKMNRIVVRKFDGAHMTFPGMNPAISLLAHQKNGVWRGLQSYQALYDHVVGAGKTFEMATLAMEMRRLGIARKPLFVVPNHLTLQWRSEFTRLYPGSNILAATPEDFSKDNRERLFAKIITGDWDAVVIGHSSLKKIGLPEETEIAVLQEQIDELADAIEDMKRARGDKRITSDMERIRKNLDAKMKDKLAAVGKRSKMVTFDELGIDAMFIDEMHEFKNLTYNTTMDRNPGMGNPAGSAKAFDLFVKVRWLFDTFGDKTPFITATGTPVSNSLVEMFNMQRYMQYPTLKREGLHVFDAWAKQFGSVENVYEVAPSGSGYRQSTRFAKFTNLPGLMSLYNTFADTITLDDLKAQEEAQGRRFPVPKMVSGRPVLFVAKRSPAVAALMGVPKAQTDEAGNILFGVDLGAEIQIAQDEKSGKWMVKVGDVHLGQFETAEDARLKVVERALTPVVAVDPQSILGRFANLRQLTKDTKGKVNALSLTGEANKAGLDFRLINPAAPDFAGSKINLAVDNMMRVYRQWQADRGAQLVFCDLSIPLSARASYSSKARRLYVRDDAGGIEMKRGTLHALSGHEDLPYFVVQRGEKDTKRFDVYDAASGLRLQSDLRTKQDAVDAATESLSSEDGRQKWIDAREVRGEIGQSEIDEYNNEHDVEAEDPSMFFTREDIAGMSGSAKFSVYDDIKAKLIAKGVPEREIAFIHDYSTPAAKDKLFRAVNSGEVRFLLGSTPKMGAGTNVQKRLVGLHHIDAPWRPSDLEQREGRIIRRGNELYARDPDGFEVFIGRYATEQTYDTRRWQILEHKARGIEQLRNYDGTLNEIDDIEGEAANAADMKAAASGDPLILEETKLRNDVRRLEQLQASHADEILSMTRKARAAQDYADNSGPNTAVELKGLIDAAAKHAVGKDGFAPVKVRGYKTDTKEATHDALSAVFQSVRAHMSDRVAVQYRGLGFELERSGGNVVLHTPTGTGGAWGAADPFSPSGMVQRLKNYIDRLPAMLDATRARIEKSKTEAASMREQAKQPFPQASALESAREGHRQVQRALMAKGPEVPEAQKAAVAAGVEQQKARLQELGFGDALQELVGPAVHDAGESTVYTVREPDSTTGDLFVGTEHALPQNTGADSYGRRRQAAANRDVRSAPALSVRQAQGRPGLYYVTSQIVTVGERSLPVDRITNHDEAAAAFAYLSDYAVEHYDAIVTNSDGRPLAIIGSFKGAATQTSVFPSTVIQELARIDGAAHLWPAHNHPSGTPELSSADLLLDSTFDRALAGSGVTYHGLIAIAGDKYSRAQNRESSRPAPIPSVERATYRLPIVERMIQRHEDARPSVTGPAGAVKTVMEIAQDKPGLVFLSAQHVPVAFVAYAPEELMPLKGNGRLLQLYRDAASTGASAAIIANPDGVISLERANNVAAALSSIEVRVLDSIEYNPRTGEKIRSSAEIGDLSSFGAVFRRSRHTNATPVNGVTGADANAFVRSLVAAFPGAPRIVMVSRFDQLPASVQKDASDQKGTKDTVKGVLNHRDGRVYVVLGNHRTMADLEATMFHEVLGHAGVRKMFGKEFVEKLNQVFLGLGGIGGLSKVMHDRGMHDTLIEYIEGVRDAQRNDPARWSESLVRAILTEEVFAHLAEQRGKTRVRDTFLELIGMVRQWLRDKGFASLARLGESDLLFMLSRARDGLRGRGLQFSFAGRDAETANRHELASAQRRIAQGEDAEAVRQDTGWHRGSDGMWRFEISDDQAQLKVGGNTAAEILDAAALDADTVRVGDVLDHPQLFAAYPHLEHIRVELMPAGEPAIARLMRDATGARMQVRGSIKRAAMPSVMLHELQHAIQGAEGFAEGGSRGALTSDLDKSGAETYRRLAGEVEARNTQSRQRMTPAQRRAVSPNDTADVPAGDVIVTFNGQPVTVAPSNAVATAPMTERGLVRALRLQFPGLVAPVESMLERGGRGQRGGLVMIDSADPLRIAGVFSKKTGRALDDSIELFSGGGKPKGFYDARSGLTFIFGPNVDAVTAPAVLLHEMVHGQQKQRIDRLARDMLMNRGTEPDADLRAFLDRVVERIVDADAVGDVREFAAYIVEQAVTEGRSRGYTMVDGRFFAWADSTLGKKMGDFLRSVAAMVRSWMIRHGGIKALTVDDLVGYAMVGVERAARGSVAGGKHVSASLSDPEVRALVEQYAGVDGAPSEAQLRDAVRQFRETERAYGGREGYDRAKSAGKTKLNYRQWVQVRTPNFMRWFGSHDIAAAIPARQAATFSDAREQAKAFQGRPLTNRATGIVATVSRNNLDKMLNSKAVGKSESPATHSLAVANLDALFEGALLGWSKPDSEGDPNIKAIHRFFTPVVVGGRAMLAKMTVKETVQESRANPLYTVEAVSFEKIENPAAQWVGEIAGADGVDPRTIRSAGLIQSMAERVQNFNPGEVSKVTDPGTGEPMVVFHGSRNGDITKFAPSTYFTEDASEAGDYATGHAVYPAYINIRRPYEASDDVDEENRSELTEIDEDYAEQLSTEGHDGVVARRNGETLWAIPFSQEHVKSAAGNVGTFDGASADIRFSRSGLATQGQTQVRTSDAFGDLSTDQRTFLDKVGTPPTRVRVSEWVKARADRIGTKIRQGLVDRYASLKELDEKLHGKDFIDTAITDSSWVMARMASSAAGAMSAMMNTGRIRFDAKQRVIAMQDGDQSGGLVAVLSQIGDPAEVERFMAWIAANRADKLMKEGREHLFTPDEIDAGKTLNVGRTTDGRGRAMVYAKAFREFQQYRDDVLAVAEATGAISAENRAMWKDEFYVPFYRVMDEEATKGAPRGSKGLSRQEAYKRLKGGSQNLNDLLENTLMNFHHLLTSGLKNQAAAQTIHNAKALGIARKVSDSERDPKTSTFVLEDGKRVFYEIDDPLVYEALTTLSDPGLNSTAVRVMSSFKRLFTNMTTVTPQFIVANLMRDLMQATATSPVSKNVFKNLGQGLKGYADEKTRAQMMASGGAFSFGHLYGADVDEVKASLARQMKGSQLISDPSMIPKAIKAGWNAWGKVTDSAENVSRAAVFQQNMDKGALRAAFEARDLMDFSSHGAWPAVRFLIRVVPFLNARLQGLDKIYRAGVKPSLLVAMGKGSASDRQAAARFAVVTGALTLATIALYLANADDDDYRELEDWQKDTYWVFKLGGSMYFLPKPFEVGAIATMAERITEQFMDDKATGKLFRDRMSDMFMQTFAFNPVPQLFQPMLDIYSNKDAFTKRDIESMSMERLSKGLRARDTTTAAAHAVSSATRALGDDSPVALSPIQADHLIRGYFGAVGANVAALIDTAWRAANGETEPDKRWSEYQPIRRFYKDLGAPEPYTRYSTLFYEGLREAARVHADVRELRSLGRMDEASALMADKRNVLAMRLTLERQQRRISEINKQLVSVRRSDRDGAWKRREIDRLNTIKGAITEQWGKLIEKARAAG